MLACNILPTVQSVTCFEAFTVTQFNESFSGCHPKKILWNSCKAWICLQFARGIAEYACSLQEVLQNMLAVCKRYCRVPTVKVQLKGYS